MRFEVGVRPLLTLIAFWLTLGHSLSCTKAPQANKRSSFNCETNPQDCNGGIDPTTASANITVNVPNNANANELFTISWEAYEGSAKYDLEIGKDEHCSADNLVITVADVEKTEQSIKLTSSGDFYVCVTFKTTTGIQIARKTGVKLVVGSGSNAAFTAASNLRIDADSATANSHSTSDDDTTIYFIWDAASDSVNGIKNYDVYYYAAANCSGTRTTVDNISTTNYTFASASFTSTYSFKVVSRNNKSETKESDCSSAITINYPTHNFTFDTAGDYTYDNTLLSVSGGVAAVLAIVQTYDDNSSTEFGLTKAHNNTTWDSDHLELKNTGVPDGRPMPRDFYHGVDSTGMVFRMALDDPWIENGDTYYDDFGRHGNVTSGTGNHSVKGKHGRAFYSTIDHITVSNHSSLQLTDFTIIVWFKSTDSSHCNVLKKDNNLSSTRNYLLGHDAAGKGWLSAHAGGDDNAISITGTKTLTDGKWHQLVGIVDGTNSYLYVDGELEGTDTHTGAIYTGTQNLVMGTDCSPVTIDEPAIFNRVLTATEIATLYSNQVKNFTHEHWTEVPGLMDGNVLLMHMDESSVVDSGTDPTITDYSGLANNGAYSSADSGVEKAVTGKIGGAINFDGNPDQIQVPDHSSLKFGTGDFTLSAWIRKTDSIVRPFISKMYCCGTMQGFAAWVNGSGFVNFQVNDNVASSSVTGSTNVEDSQWHHIVAVRVGTTAYVYVDGRLDVSGAVQGGDTSRTDVLQVGRGSSSSEWRGDLDEVAIWNRALSSKEIQTIYNLQSGTYRGNIFELPDNQSATVDDWFPMNGNVLLMHLNETSIVDSGTNPGVYDYSGNNYDGSYSANDDSLEKSTTGQLGGALTLDGTDDYVDLGDVLDFERTDSFTLSCWFKTTVGNTPCIAKINNTGGLGGYELRVGDTTQFYLISSWSSSAIHVYNNTDFHDNKWHHAVVTYDGSSTAAGAKLYVDGLQLTPTVGNDNLTTTTVTVRTFRVGARNNGGAQFNGTLDEIAVWNRVLSEDEIRKIYDYQSGKYSGTFTSDVINTGSSTASWTTLAWDMIRPYGKELGANSDLSSSYTSLPNDTLMNGNVLLMHFNETAEDTVGSGPTYDVEDFSSNDYHGTTTGSPTYKALGKFGYAMEFNGSSDRVSTAAVNWGFSTTGTVSAWINTNETSDGGIVSIAHGTVQDELLLMVRSTGKLGFFNHSSGGNYNVRESSTLVNTGEWIHVVGVIDGGGATSNLSIYLNGQNETGTTNTSGTPVDISDATARTATIGHRLTTADLFDGLIDEVAVWDRALSATEIQELYRRGASRIRYQVRSCDASGCDDEAWIIPDSTLTPYASHGEFFSELHNTTTSVPSLTFGGFGSHTVSNNQFFQWRAFLDTSNTSEIPELKSVTVGPAHYYGGNPTIINSTADSFSSLLSFTETVSTGSAKYQLSNDGGTTWYWYNSGWTATTSTYAESSSASDINTNIATFPVGSGSLKVKAFLSSANASEATSLSNVAIQYVP